MSSNEDHLEEFRIIFDNAEAVFYAGSEISGRVFLRFSTPTQVRSVKLSLYGMADLKWEKHGEKGGPKRSIQREMQYLSEKSTLFQVGSGNSSQSLGKKHKRKLCPKGTSEFSFKKQLPEDLPTSFEGPQGHIRYNVKASLILPKSWNGSAGDSKGKITAQKGFTVIRAVDLNSVSQDLLTPVVQEGQKELGKACCGCCCKGEISFQLRLPRSAYVAGENLPISGYIDNNSGKRMEKATARVELHANFYGNHGNKTQYIKEICRATCAMYLDKNCQVRIDRALALPPLVPSTPPTEVHSSLPLITIGYQLIFTIHPMGLKPFDTVIPLVIGTTPISDTQASQYYKSVVTKNLHNSSHSGRSDEELSMVYREPFWEKKINLKRVNENEMYFCDETELLHVNKYPFWVGLNTSSKYGKMMVSAMQKRF